MALTKLTDDAIRAFLQRAEPAMLGVVGTNGAGGFPHLVPVWYHYDGERVHIWTLESRAWVQNLARDNRVAFSVQEEKVSSTGVTLQGRAAITTGEEPFVLDAIRRITLRYVPDPADAETYIQRWPRLRTIVSISPEKVNGWADDGG